MLISYLMTHEVPHLHLDDHPRSGAPVSATAQVSLLVIASNLLLVRHISPSVRLSFIGHYCVHFMLYYLSLLNFNLNTSRE